MGWEQFYMDKITLEISNSTVAITGIGEDMEGLMEKYAALALGVDVSEIQSHGTRTYHGKTKTWVVVLF